MMEKAAEGGEAMQYVGNFTLLNNNLFIIGAFLLVLVVTLFGEGVASLLKIAMFLFTSYKTFEAIELKGDTTQWLLYWIVFVFFSIILDHIFPEVSSARKMIVLLYVNTMLTLFKDDNNKSSIRGAAVEDDVKMNTCTISAEMHHHDADPSMDKENDISAHNNTNNNDEGTGSSGNCSSNSAPDKEDEHGLVAAGTED